MGDRDRQSAKPQASGDTAFVSRLRNSLFLPLAALMLITVALVPPRGDFPLNDDWIYAKTVEHLLDTGTYEANPYGDPTLIAQAYWGALFCSVFGYSFTVLRVSTLVLCLMGAWAAALCVRSRGLPHAAALLFGALFIANPIVMNLSYTFMTDVPFLAVATISGLSFLKSLEKEMAIYVLLGSAAAVAAFFIRQFGLLLPAAFAATWIVLLIRKRVRFSWGVPAALLTPWAVAGGLMLVLPELGAGTGGADWDWNELGYTTLERARGVLGHVLIGSVYVSLFTLPILFARLWPSKDIKPWGRRRIAVFTAITGVVAYFVLLPKPHRLPLMGNSIYDLGVGPMLLRGSVIDSEIAAPLRIGWGWWFMTALCVLATTLFILECLPYALRAFLRKPQDRIEDSERAAGQDLFLFLW
ncbi:MAG: glycosyltransferase family 39 protein, partial [Candidatus Hydrogenedentes bacterium]|nr:glycosyltransferase family 39 protein [Candidatus Hydrogenedentota bacterium]